MNLYSFVKVIVSLMFNRSNRNKIHLHLSKMQRQIQVFHLDWIGGKSVFNLKFYVIMSFQIKNSNFTHFKDIFMKNNCLCVYLTKFCRNRLLLCGSVNIFSSLRQCFQVVRCDVKHFSGHGRIPNHFSAGEKQSQNRLTHC